MPTNKMERFTQRARRVLSLAQEEAEQSRNNTIGTEYILVGLLREEGGIAGHVLRDLGLEIPRVEELIEELTGATIVHPRPTTTELTPGSKQILEIAVDEARRMGHHYIGTEHLLLGLVRQSEGVAIDVLKRLGVSPDEVRRITRRVLQESPVQPNVGISKPVSQTVPPIPPEARRRLPADAYEMLENVLMKILEMIEAGKLPVAQGVELFSTLTPDLKLTSGQQAELISHLFDQKKFNDYKVQLKVMDSKGVEILNQTDLPLTTLLAEIDRFLAAVLNDPTTPLVFMLGDSSLEVRIEKDEPSA
jgi:hypothetical protein